MGDSCHEPVYDLSRRKFFPALCKELLVYCGVVRGGEAFRLSDLALMPDDRIARIVPVLNTEFAIEGDGGEIVVRDKKSGRCMQLSTDEARLAMLDLFDGSHTLGEVVSLLVCTGMDDETAFEECKSFFLLLSSHRIFLPKNAAV